MSLWKFISMLQSRILWFSNGIYLAEKYDKNEGHFPIPIIEKSQKEKERIEQQHKGWDTIVINLGWSLARLRKENSKYVYVNCWHANEYEYPFMWKLYSGKEIGIAIESTIEQLRDSIIVPNCSLCKIFSVIYYDKKYDKGSMRFDWSAFIYKKLYYEYENEIRVILFKIKNKENEKKEFYEYEDYKGYCIKVKLDNLINKIYIDPNSTDKIKLVQSLVDKYKLDKKVSSSILSEKPPY